MKRFVITENEKQNILGMYGLINENPQTSIPQSSGKKTKTIVHGGDPNKLRQELKNIGSVYDILFSWNPNAVTVRYSETGTIPYSLSYIYSDRGELEKVLEKVEQTNKVESAYTTDYNIGKYFIIIKKKKIVDS